LDLEAKTYEDLREPGDNCQRILVVLLMPPEESRWVTQTSEKLILRRAAYWLSLEGFPATQAKRTVRIAIPRKNLFTVKAVAEIMAELCERKNP